MLDTGTGTSISTLGEGAHGVLATDNTTLDLAGDIATKEKEAYGVYLYYYLNTLSLTGDVSTIGEGSHGIYAASASSTSNANTVTIGSGGSVATQKDDAYGVWLGDFNILSIEAGAHIATTGDDAYGVYAGSNTTISNASTTIGTAGSGAHGIYLAGSSNTVGVGAITTSDDDAYGVYAAGDDNRIILSSGDFITTSGAAAHGIYLDGSGNEVTNYGAITASGTGSVGIYSTGGNTITTHGKITGDQYAIYIAGTGDTVNFMQGMTLVGDVYVADADNTFFFGDDLNATITVSGVLPTNVSGEDFLLRDPTYYVEPGIGGSCTILVTDPTGFAMLDEMLDDATGPVFEAVGRRLSGAPRAPPTSPRSTACSSRRRAARSGGRPSRGRAPTAATATRRHGATSDRRGIRWAASSPASTARSGPRRAPARSSAPRRASSPRRARTRAGRASMPASMPAARWERSACSA